MKSRRPGGDRGGIRKRGATRTDRDGDMDMDGPGGRGGKRRGGGSNRPSGSGSGSGAGVSRPSRAGGDRPQARDKTLDAIQKALLDTRETQVNIRKGKPNSSGNLESFGVRGWKASNAASNRDGGVESLLAFLERKMNSHTKSGPRAKITKVCATSAAALLSHHLRHHPTRAFSTWPRRQPGFGVIALRPS